MSKVTNPVYFVAGTFQEARYWSEKKGFGHGEWLYVQEANSLRGLHNVDIVCVGTWERRPDAKELAWAVSYHSKA